MILTKVIKKVSDYATLVMFSHTIFSLSFAVVAMLLASKGFPSVWVICWILIAFLGARTGANAINRVIDAEIDRRNPRTASRQIPQGTIKKGEVIVFTTISFAVMIYSAAMLNPICVMLSPFALVLLIGYSYTKRFTWMCHVILGLTTAAAPVGAWLAVTGKLGVIPIIMGAANTLWVAGFDIIYGTQDYDFDIKNGIHSIPARFGIKSALIISSVFHLISTAFLILLGLFSDRFGVIYFIGIIIIALLFWIEHTLIEHNTVVEDTTDIERGVATECSTATEHNTGIENSIETEHNAAAEHSIEVHTGEEIGIPESKTNITIKKDRFNFASYTINQIISMVFLIFSLADIFIS